MVGGEGSDGVAHNDVWRSVDGSLWELCCVEATWNPCYNHAVVLHSQKMKEDNDPLVSCQFSEANLERILYVIGGLNRMQREPNSTYQQAMRSSVDPDNINTTKLDYAASSTESLSLLDAANNNVVGVTLRLQPRNRIESAGHAIIGFAIENSSELIPLKESVPLSMQAVISSVMELYRLRAGLEEVQRGNQQIVNVVQTAASLEIASLEHSTAGRKISFDSKMADTFSDAIEDEDAADFDQNTAHRAINSSSDRLGQHGLAKTDSNRELERSGLSRGSSMDLFHDAEAPVSPLRGTLEFSDASTRRILEEKNMIADLSDSSMRVPSGSPHPQSRPDQQYEQRFIQPAALASLSENIRDKRLQLRNFQEKIRHVCFELAGGSEGWLSRIPRPDRSFAVEEGDGDTKTLETLITERTDFVKKCLFEAQSDLATLRSFTGNPKIWQRRLEKGKNRITEAIRHNLPPEKAGGSTIPVISVGAGIGRISGGGETILSTGNSDDGTGPWAVGTNRPRTQSLMTFQEAESELKSLLEQPKQPKSLRSATDDALERLRECLELRARAARGVLPSTDNTGSLDMSTAAKALAWAQLWDGNEVLSKVKLQVCLLVFRRRVKYILTHLHFLYSRSGSYCCRYGVT